MLHTVPCRLCGVTEIEMKALNQYKSLAWLCSACKDGFSKTFTAVVTALKLRPGCANCHLKEALSEQAKMLVKVSDGQEHIADVVKASNQKLESTVLVHNITVIQKARDDDDKRQHSYGEW